MTQTQYHVIIKRNNDIQKRIMLETGGGDRLRKGKTADDRSGKLLDRLVAIYLDLTHSVGQPPTPDMLLRLGEPGRTVHAVTCQTAGMWRAFRKLVASRHPEVESPTSVVEGSVRLGSQQERLVFRELSRLPGVVEVQPHPRLRPGSQMLGDFRVTASNQKVEFVEVAMVAADPSTDSHFYRSYRERLCRKLACYSDLGHDPVLVWADDLAPPRRLLQRINMVATRLGLDPLPLPARMWFEGAAA